MGVELAEHALQRAVDELVGLDRRHIAFLDLAHRILDQAEIAGRRVGRQRRTPIHAECEQQPEGARERCRHHRWPMPSLFLIGLPLRARRGKGIEFHAALIDPHDGRIGCQIQAVAAGIDHLRD